MSTRVSLPCFPCTCRFYFVIFPPVVGTVEVGRGVIGVVPVPAWWRSPGRDDGARRSASPAAIMVSLTVAETTASTATPGVLFRRPTVAPRASTPRGWDPSSSSPPLALTTVMRTGVDEEGWEDDVEEEEDHDEGGDGDY